MLGTRRATRICVVTVAATFELLSACGNHGSAVSVSKNQILGEWFSSTAGRIELRDNGLFLASGLKFSSPASDGCERNQTKGEWSFLSDGIDGVGDYSLTVGKAVGVVLGDGACSFQLNARKINNDTVLCLTTDPGEPCGDGIDFAMREKESK